MESSIYRSGMELWSLFVRAVIVFAYNYRLIDNVRDNT